MNKWYSLYLILAIWLISGKSFAQSWKPLGPVETTQPTISQTFGNSIATAPDGTTYIAYSSDDSNNLLTVKKFDGANWQTVGAPGFTEAYTLSPSLAIGPDGTPYVAYVEDSSSGSYFIIGIKKFSAGAWVNVGNLTVGFIAYPSLAIANDGTPYLAYSANSTLYIKKFSNGYWTNVGPPFAYGVYGSYDQLKIAPDGTLYLAYADPGYSNKVTVKKYANNTWNTVGNAGFTAGAATDLSFTIAPNGTPYVSYGDAGNSGKLSVMQYDGNSWVNTGAPGFSTGAATYTNLIVGNNGTPYAVACDAGNSQKSLAKQFNGSTWTDVGGTLSSGTFSYNSICLGADGSPYVFFHDGAFAGKGFVKKLNGGTWTFVGTGGLTVGATTAFTLKADASGNFYIAYIDPSNQNTAYVKKYVSGSWQTVGTNFSPANVNYLDMSIAPNGMPYVIYISPPGTPVIEAFNGTSWSFVGANAATDGHDAYAKINFAPDGTPYIAFANINSVLTVRKFVSGNWTDVGTAVTSTYTYNINLEIAPDGTPYVAYTTNSLNQANVKKFVSNAWQQVGAANLTGGQYTSDSNFLNLAIAPNGTPYISYSDQLNGAKATVKSFDGTNWNSVGPAAISTGYSYYSSLRIGADGSPYLAYQDASNLYTISLLNYKNSSWQKVGTGLVCPAQGSSPVIAIPPSGNIAVAYSDPQLFVTQTSADILPPVYAPPVITSILPKSGPIGTSVTISGNNFSSSAANNIVYFGATKAVVNSATANQLNVTAPTGANYQPISVLSTDHSLTGYATDAFIGTYNSKNAILSSDFGPRVDLQTGNSPYSVTVSDLDGDGKPDIIVANNGSNTVSIYRNISGSGSLSTASFAPKVDLQVGLSPDLVTVTDLNGDGKPDIIVANQFDNTITVLRNNSTAGNITASSFATRADVVVGFNPQSVAVADINGDGRPDLIVNNSTSNTISVYQNIGTGGAINFNSFAAKVDIATGNGPSFICARDMDGDGKTDIVVLNTTSNTVSVFRNISSGSTITTSSFAAKVDFSTGGTPSALQIADIDGDGKLDIIVANLAANTISVLRNTSTAGTISTSSFAAKVDFATGTAPTGLAVGDIDGDGLPDIAVSNGGNYSASVFRNTATQGSITATSLAAKADITTGQSPLSLALNDLDADGKPDILVVNQVDNTLSIFHNNPANPPVTPSAPQITAFSPATGTAGTLITITGTSLDNVTAVSVGGVAVTSFNIISPTTITAIIGQGSSGSLTVNGTGGTASASGFTFIGPPVISYSPQTYYTAKAITPLAPINTGTAIPNIPYGTTTTVAGNGSMSGFTNGTGSSATFGNATGIAIDQAGNLYVADQNNNVIRKITPANVVTTYAGTGLVGEDDGPAASATFNTPSSVCIDAAGNLYIAEYYGSLVRKISAAGIVTTIAGNPVAGAVNGIGKAASFHNPTGITIDAAGYLYVADQGNNMIRKISPAGVVSTYAGNLTAGSANGTGAAASFNAPWGVAADRDGNIYVVDAGDNTLRKIDKQANVTTIVSSALVAPSYALNTPHSLTVDGAGNIYISDTQNDMIRRISSTDGTIGTVAGSSTYGEVDGIGSAARFDYPTGITTDLNGNLYITDNNTVRKVTATGYTINPALPLGLSFDGSTGAISGTPVFAAPAKTYTVTANNTSNASTTVVITILASPPPSITYDTPKTYLISTPITPLSPVNTGGPALTTLAGQCITFAGSRLYGSADGNTTSASFKAPQRITADNNGYIYVADANNNMIRKIDPQGNVSTLAGNGTAGNANGTGTAALFYNPTGLVTDAAGNIYVADANNNLIRKITPAGVVTTIAGSGATGSANGTGVSATFNHPNGIVMDSSGNLYVSDQSNHMIREITPAGVVTTFAGAATSGSTNGTGIAARFNLPAGLAIDANGNIYVADLGNNKIRKITPAGVVSTFAGSGSAGLLNSFPTSSTFNSPIDVAVDASGNVYVADESNNVIRKIPLTGLVTTYAGSTGGFADGPIAAAKFYYCTGVAIDKQGNLYVADSGNELIRKICVPGFNITPVLSAGLSFDTSTGTISGTPTVVSTARNYTVSAFNTSGGGTTTVNIAVLLPQTITFSLPATKTYGDIDFNAGATSTNTNNPITYSSSNPAVATVTASGTIHILSAGTSVITAMQAADATHAAAPSVNQTLTVAPALLNITADNQTKNYGGANPTLTASYSGFVNGDDATKLTTQPSVVTTVTAASAVGSYPITSSGATSANYTITYAVGTLTVAPAPLTITADNQSKNYGTANPALTANYAGFVNGDDATKLTTQPTIITTATGASAVGSYSVTASGAASNNYTITYAAGTLTVNPVTLTITANNQSKNYGAANPTLTASYNGFINGDDATKLSTQPTIVTTATAASPVGAYPVTASGAASANYTVIYAAGTLTVNPTSLTITPNNQSKNYGAANPTLTASYTGFVNGDDATKLTTQPAMVTTATLVSAVGTYPITASGATSSNYTITYAAGTLTVNPVALTITANNQSKNYGAATPTLTASYNGFINGDDATKLTTQPTIVTTATAASPVGTYAVTASGAASANYTITYGAGTLTVNPTSLTITANNQSKNYGAANPTLTAGYTGFVNGDDATKLTTQPTIVTTATPTSVVGAYPVTASGATSANYTVAYVAGALTVNPAPLTIKANNQSKNYGAPTPTLTASYTGFANGDNATMLTTQPIILTTATAASAVGTYPVTASGAASANYTITYAAGNLTVNPVGLTITANNQSRNYSSANPSLTASYTGFVNGDDATKLTTQPAITTTATAASAVGTYPVTANGAASNNYTITYAAGTLTVNPVALTITANNQSKNYGAANPTLTISYTGFVNGDDATKLTTQPIITTIATANSGPGTYPITVGGAVSTNYTISYIAGTMYVSSSLPAGNFTIAANSATCRGSANGTISITAAQNLNYTATITGGNVNATYPFTTGTTINNLAAGTYNVCFTVTGQSNYQQCFTVVITEPKDLSVYTAVNNSIQSINLTLDGGNIYYITLNGITTSTTSSNITLSLNNGVNELTVTTDKPCQGIIQKQISISDGLIAYPNPFATILNVNLGDRNLPQATVALYSINGVKGYSKQFTNQSGVIQLDLSSLKPGMYVLKIASGNSEKIYKVVKQ